ncbi:hypothetical protein C5167_004050 [Papaver somniferum]|nr:hypothetical protein C5167_004050 [Papaver somniferum]
MDDSESGSEPQLENSPNNVEKQPKKTPRSSTRLPLFVSENIPAKKLVLLNDVGMPVVRGQVNLKSYMGVISRFEVESDLKKTLLSGCGELWRNFKSRLTKTILEHKDQPEKLKKPPEEYPQIRQQQWDRFVTSRLSEEFQIERGDYTPDKIDRGVLWKEARKVNGEYKDEACKQKGDDIDEFEKRRKDGTLDEDSDIDAITKVFGPEHAGRVRAAGKYVTPNSFFGKQISRFRVTKAQYDAVLEENKRLKLANVVLEKEVLEYRQSHQSSAAYGAYLAQSTLFASSRSPKIRKKSVTATKRRSSEVEKASGPHLAQPTMSESSKSPKIRKKPVTTNTVSSEVEKLINGSVDRTDAQRSRLGEGTPCKLFTDFDELAAGNVFDSTPGEKVHNVPIGVGNLRVQVLTGKDLEALVPIPVEDEIVTVDDALGSFLAWPKKLIVVEKKPSLGLNGCKFKYSKGMEAGFARGAPR